MSSAAQIPRNGERRLSDDADACYADFTDPVIVDGGDVHNDGDGDDVHNDDDDDGGDVHNDDDGDDFHKYDDDVDGDDVHDDDDVDDEVSGKRQ